VLEAVFDLICDKQRHDLPKIFPVFQSLETATFRASQEFEESSIRGVVLIESWQWFAELVLTYLGNAQIAPEEESVDGLFIILLDCGKQACNGVVCGHECNSESHVSHFIVRGCVEKSNLGVADFGKSRNLLAGCNCVSWVGG
jgi:hypothetical protein